MLGQVIDWTAANPLDNPNSGKRKRHSWDSRRSTNYAHSNLIRMGIADYKKVTVSRVKPTVAKGTRPIVKLGKNPPIKGVKKNSRIR